LPDFPRLREKTKTSAPSLIVLVLKPLPSTRKQIKDTECKKLLPDILWVNIIYSSKLTLPNSISNFALNWITQGHALPHFIRVHATAIIYKVINKKRKHQLQHGHLNAISGPLVHSYHQIVVLQPSYVPIWSSEHCIRGQNSKIEICWLLLWVY
jgi:hypothetical protein